MTIHSFTQTCLVVKMLHYPQEMEKRPPKQAKALLNKPLRFLRKSRTPIPNKANKQKNKKLFSECQSLYQICFICIDKWKEKGGEGVKGLEYKNCHNSIITITLPSPPSQPVQSTTSTPPLALWRVPILFNFWFTQSPIVRKKTLWCSFRHIQWEEEWRRKYSYLSQTCFFCPIAAYSSWYLLG